MSWEWFRFGCLTSIFFWWFVIVVVSVVSYPILERLRTWQATRRFIRRQGVQLQNRENAEARFQLANLYARGRSWRTAEGYAREAVAAASENPLYEGRVPYHFLTLYGQTLYKRGKLEEAVAVFDQALASKSDTGYEAAHVGVGKALYRRGDVVRALEHYRVAAKINESNLETYFRIAQAAARQGRGGEAADARVAFKRVARALPRFARQKRLRWRLAFLLFPLSRWVA